MIINPSPRTVRILNVLGAGLALLFLASGLSKLGGLPMQEHLFDAFGFPRWFMYAVGGVEVVGATLVAIPRTRPYGAMLLGVVMVGATLSRAFTGVALPLMFTDALLASTCIWVAREDRPAFLVIHWKKGREAPTEFRHPVYK